MASGKGAKGAILDEFVAMTGVHRKHTIRNVDGDGSRAPAAGAPEARYGRAVIEALAVLWEASDRVCSKRLKPMIPMLLPALERHGQIEVDEGLRGALLSVSPATIDRLLSEVRIAAAQGRRRRARFSSTRAPLRSGADLRGLGRSAARCFVEVDFGAHSGTSAAGAFVQTMVLTDIATGWTECVPVVMRAGALALEALQIALDLFPFPLKGVDFDNDGAFMNESVVAWCRAQGLDVTRSRAYRKNDQAWVEQKNGAVVRRLVGYGRFEGPASAAAIAPALRRGPSAEPLPAKLQASREDPHRPQGHEALACAGDAGRPGAGERTADRGQRAADRRSQDARRSGGRPRRDPRSSGRARETGRPSAGPDPSTPRRRS